MKENGSENVWVWVWGLKFNQKKTNACKWLENPLNALVT